MKSLSTSAAFVVVLGADRKVCFVNRKCCALLGCEAEQIVGKDWFGSFLPEAFRSAAEQAFRALMAGETLQEYSESPVLTKKGETGKIAWHSSALQNGKGRIAAILVFGGPLAEQKIDDRELGRMTLWNPVLDHSGRDLAAVKRVGDRHSTDPQRQTVQQELLKNQRRLADLVRERTAELVEVNRSLEAEVVERRRAEQNLRDFSARLMLAQEEERSWLARELHDDLSQKLALLAVELEQLGQKPPRSLTEIRKKTLELWRQTQKISSDLHYLSRQLHPSQFKLLGLVPALRRFCLDFGEQQGLTIRFSSNQAKIAPPLKEEIALCLYRIVQEALHNVAAHSRAREAEVELATSRDCVRLCVSDPGVGFDKEAIAARPGLGLVSMRERISLVGGTLNVETEPSGGTRIMASVPLLQPEPRGERTPAPEESNGD